MLNYHQFLIENSKKYMDPFVADFIADIQSKAKDETGTVKLSGSVEGSNSCWWCSSSESLFETYRSNSKNSFSLTQDAENEERVERKKSMQEKHITPFYLIELQISIEKTAHIYIVAGINMIKKEFFVQQIRDVSDSIEKIFDDLMKKHYPTVRTSKKYGLS